MFTTRRTRAEELGGHDVRGQAFPDSTRVELDPRRQADTARDLVDLDVGAARRRARIDFTNVIRKLSQRRKVGVVAE
jgi:hypothetical protein